MMHAVGISLGSSSAVVAVAVANAAETTLDIRVTANSAGHRTTPAMAAFADHGELLFGQDARALYARTPDVVVPYLFAFAAVAEEHRRYHGDSNYYSGDNSDKTKIGDERATALRHRTEEPARSHYKGHCSFVNEGNDSSQRLGFYLPNQSNEEEGGERRGFIPVEDLLVEFFNHVKKHTVDGVCGLTATSQKSPLQEEPTPQEERSKIIISVVVPRHLFPEAVTPPRTAKGSADDDNNHRDTNNSNGNNKKEQQRDATQWVRDAILGSHFGAVAAHVSVLFADEAALLAMDAVPCRPHPAHPMANRYFLLPSSASPAVVDNVAALPWPSARVLVVDWGALGVSLTRLQLEGGCLVDEPRPLFLRATQTVANMCREELGFAVTPCGGGDSVNLALRERLATAFAQQKSRVLGYRFLSDFPARAQRRLLLVAEDKKVVLSKATQVPVEIEALAEGIDLLDTVTFSRVRVDAALRGEWKLLEAFEKVLTEYVRLLEQESDGVIDAVVLCGGMLQMPCIAQSLRQLFTQCALTPKESRRVFAHNLVIMEAGRSTTVNAFSSDSNGLFSPQTIENSANFGPEELLCIGGCLYSYQLALAALQREFYGCHDSVTNGKNKKKKMLLSRREQERIEGARHVWRALTHGDSNINNDDDQAFKGVMVLQRSVFIYTHTNLDALRLAVAQQKSKSAPLQLPTAMLSVLFAPHTLLPARVVVPLTEKSNNPPVIYLFTEFKVDKQQQQGETPAGVEALSSVLPLSDAGLTLSVSEDKMEGETWKHCVVFTLREGGNKDSQSTPDKSTTTLQLVVQLVRFVANASPPPVLKPADVRASVTLDL